MDVVFTDGAVSVNFTRHAAVLVRRDAAKSLTLWVAFFCVKLICEVKVKVKQKCKSKQIKTFTCVQATHDSDLMAPGLRVTDVSVPNFLFAFSFRNLFNLLPEFVTNLCV